jgi:hypothetical protein
MTEFDTTSKAATLLPSCQTGATALTVTRRRWRPDSSRQFANAVLDSRRRCGILRRQSYNASVSIETVSHSLTSLRTPTVITRLGVRQMQSVDREAIEDEDDKQTRFL